MGSRSANCTGCWCRGCRLMSCLRCSTCLPHHDVAAPPVANAPATVAPLVANAPAPAAPRPVPNAPAPPPVANALKQLPEMTLEQLEQTITLIEQEFARLDRASTSSSSQAPISQRLGNMLSQWEEKKQICTSFINSLPKDLTNEVAGDGRKLLLPLLTDALHGAGGVHWLGVGFTFIAWSLDNINNSIQNREDCIGILKRSLRHLRKTMTIWQATSIHDNAKKIHEDLQDSVEKALRCALFCTSILSDGWILRFWKATNVKDAIAMLAVELDRATIENMQFAVTQNLEREAAKVERQITFSISHDDIAGERDVIEDAVTFLQTSSDEIKAVLLHGMGGIGKSFLGLRIFTEFQKQKGTYRACRVELQLETKPGDLCAIQKQILEKVCNRAAPPISNLVDGKQHLEKELKQISDPLFLYADNVLEYQFLTDLLPMAEFFPKGSRILITSRGEYVKPGILDLGIRDYNYKPIEVRKLQEQHAQELLWKQLESKGEHRDIAEVNESLEKRVLALCEGLPLALVVVGKYIANGKGLENVEVWREVVDSMQKAEALDGSANDKLYSRIKFSLDNLAPNVKLAFLDMIFFLDVELDWDSWRRIGRDDWARVERLISHRYLKVLSQRALVRKGENNTAEIHDVLKVLGRKMVADDKLELRITGMDKFKEHNDSASLKKVVALIGVTVNAYQLKEMPRLRLLSNVDVEGDCQEIQVTSDLRVVERLSCSTARVFDWSKIASSLKEISWGKIDYNSWEPYESGAPNVSNLAEVFKRDHISNMGLEALALLGWGQLKDVDVIETLTCLKELRLPQCGAIESIPEGISRLTGLKLLDLCCCEKLKGLPQGISSLTCLEFLRLSYCESVQSLPDGLTSLTRLTHLALRGCKSLQSIPEGIGNLRGVTELDLCGCESLESIPEGAASLMSGPTTILSFDGCSRIETLPQGISTLMGFKKLSLQKCASLQSLPEGLMTHGLRSLNLSSCRSLRALPEGTASLIKLDLRWCKALQYQELPRLSTGLTDLRLAACSSLLQDIPEKLGFMSTRLRHLQLSFLQMQSLPDEISELTGLVLLDLSSCKSLQSIKGVTTLTALIALNVDDCTELKLLPQGLTSLTSLRYIGLRGCRSLESIPEELGHLPGLHRLPLEYDMEYLSGFDYEETHLNLDDCESLKSLPQSIGSFTLLDELCLQNCTSLKSLPEAVTRLSNLAKLSLLGCRSLESLPSGLISSFTGLTELKIGECAMKVQPILEEVSNWSSMRRLKVLKLSKCEDLQSLPKGITTLTSLRELSVSGCTNFQWLPQGMANWRGNLSRLDLSGCESLQSLPEELTTMTAIAELDLSGCAGLRSLPHGIFASLASLEWLNIIGCGGIQLAEAQEIRRLTGLESLDLSESEHLLLLLSEHNILALGLRRLALVGCKSLQCLPEGVAALEELVVLSVSGCESLQSLSNLPQGSTHCLRVLDLSGCGGLDRPSVWEMIVNFTSLTSLNLSRWESMQALPDQIASLKSLERLDLSKCSSLLSLPESVSKLQSLHQLTLAHCKSLRSLPPGITHLVNLELLDLSGCTSLDQPLPEAFSVWISCICDYRRPIES